MIQRTIEFAARSSNKNVGVNHRCRYGHTRVKTYWKEFSPIHNISQDTPPTIVFLGTKDKLIPVKTAKEYKRLMEEKGRRCDLHLYEGQPHGFFNYTKKENYTKTVIEMDRFLASLRYLEGEPILQNKKDATHEK
jgi:acetyl esterase